MSSASGRSTCPRPSCRTARCTRRRCTRAWSTGWPTTGTRWAFATWRGRAAGVADYENKMRVPNVAGAALHDPGYTANPLVFCGCVGAVPGDLAWLVGPQPGDHVLVLGGATGRDGIKGATFSSAGMDATTGE